MTALFAQLRWREKDGSFKAPSSCADGNEKGAQSLSTSGGSCFWWGASFQAAERLLEVQHFHVGHSSQGPGSQDPAPPPPKRPAQTQPPPVSNNKPKQILSPRAEVGVTMVKVFSAGNLPKRGKRPWSKSVGTFMTFWHWFAWRHRGCPHYCQETDHSPEKIAGRLLNSRGGGGGLGRDKCGPLGHVHRAVGVQGSGGRSIFLPERLRALPELHFGDASVNPRGPTSGPVVNVPRLERFLLSYRDQPSWQKLPMLLSQWHRLAVDILQHSGCQPVWEYLPKYSNQY